MSSIFEVEYWFFFWIFSSKSNNCFVLYVQKSLNFYNLLHSNYSFIQNSKANFKGEKCLKKHHFYSFYTLNSCGPLYKVCPNGLFMFLFIFFSFHHHHHQQPTTTTRCVWQFDCYLVVKKMWFGIHFSFQCFIRRWATTTSRMISFWILHHNLYSIWYFWCDVCSSSVCLSFRIRYHHKCGNGLFHALDFFFNLFFSWFVWINRFFYYYIIRLIIAFGRWNFVEISLMFGDSSFITSFFCFVFASLYWLSPSGINRWHGSQQLANLWEFENTWNSWHFGHFLHTL